jgi:eukaryotic-like serine/threonine-protein kinase
MATVYLAEDTKHHRQVALKVLLPELAASLGADRFRREIQLAARLQHPHILSVHDSGETPDGQLWFTMPYIEGESLRDRLRRQRQLPVDDAVRIAREVSLALDYAHRHGVIHRDVKPENILLVDGQALVADFGIARSLSAPSANESLTATGMSLGTPAYMSPEQMAGERVLDGTTDVYSLGVVLFEMLAGELPYSGPSAQAIAVKMMTGEVPSVRRSRPTVPQGVDVVIRKALAPVPADRYATAADFARALEAGAATAHPPSRAPRISIYASLAAAAVVLALAAYAWRSSVHKTGPSNGPASGAVRLAVLPFDNLGDSGDAYFADGMTDAVREKLTAVSGLEVIAPASSSQYRHSTKSLSDIGRELGARYLVVGKVRWAKSPGTPSRVEVRPSLVEASSAADKWEQSFDAPLTDVFHVQAQIADQVASKLRMTLTPAAQQDLAARPTQNLVAYDAYLRGLALSRSSNSAVMQRRAATAFREAVRLDSTFAEAWARLASAEQLVYTNGVPDPALGDSIRDAANRALALAPDLASAHGAKAFYYGAVEKNILKSQKELELGLATSPSDARLLNGMAAVQQVLGHWDAVISYYQQAARLDPRSPAIEGALAHAQIRMRDFTSARAAADRALEIRPDGPGNIEGSAMVSLAEGNLAGAQSALRTGLALSDTAALIAYFGNYWDLGWVLDTAQDRIMVGLGPAAFDGDKGTWGIVLAQQYAFRGRIDLARAWADTARVGFEKNLKRSQDDAQQHVFLGLALAYLGRKDEAIHEGLRGVALDPIDRDGSFGPYYQHQLARIYILVGEPEKALDALEPLLKIPYFLSPGWLKIDPNFAPLRGNPRFERLLAAPATQPPIA